MPLHEVSSLEILIWKALQCVSVVLFIVVPALSAFWAWSAYRSSKKRGYIWLTVFALTPYFTFTLQKASNWIYQEEIAKVRAQRSDGALVVEKPISLPIYELVFATGVFLLYRAEKSRANQPIRPTLGSVTPPAAQAPRQPPSSVDL